MTADGNILVAFITVIVAVFSLHAIRRFFSMPVDPRVQASLDKIATSMQALAAKPDQSAALAEAEQNATDTATAVENTAAAIQAQIGA